MKRIICFIFGHIAHRKDLKHYKRCQFCGVSLKNYQCGTFWGQRI
jgi:hypothetical protein